MARLKPVKRRYLLRVAVSMAVYVVSLFAADHLIEEQQVSGAPAFVLALLPGLAVVGFFYAIGMFILEQKDEFIRMLMVRQQLIATGFAMSIASVWGFLEMFEVVPHANGFWIVVVWAVGMLIGGLSNRITHGSWGECW